ncbi:MAG: glycosyltransferase, partial [Candidatus Dadabacteria bacterium]
DNTLEIARQLSKQDNRIRIYENNFKLGIKKNFETALQYANGQWIALSDQDDIWVADKLEKLLGCRTTTSLLIHSYNAEFSGTDSNRAVVNRKRKRFSGNNTRELFFYNTIYGHTVLLDKKLLQWALPFPPVVHYDWWLGIIASVHGTVEVNEDSLVYHREHNSNYSRIIPGDEKAAKEIFFKELAATINEFLSIEGIKQEDKKILLEYRSLIGSESEENFSLPIFKFFLKHASSAFYFRKKNPAWFYYLKYSLYRATRQVKHWT